MINHFNKFLTIIFIYLTLLSCKQTKSNFSVTEPICDTSLNLDTPILKKENIINELGRINSTYTFVQDNIKGVGLKSYDKGYDSLAIRLFYSYFNPESDIIEIRKNCEGWIGQFTKIKRSTYNDKKLFSLLENRFIYPKSGWQNFTKRIFNLGILTLPNYVKIPNYNASTDGHSLIVEISTSKFYRIYEYPDPITNTYIKEARNVEEIMKIIEEEFGIIPKIKI